MKDIIYRSRWFIAIVLIFSFLAACSPQDDGVRQTSAELDMVIIYERQGGFTGISQEWVIHPDGTIDGPGEEQLVVPPEDVQQLMEKGVDSDLESLSSETANTETCCDQMTYTLTVLSGDNEWRLITTDTAEQAKEVTELFIMVQALIADAQPVP